MTTLVTRGLTPADLAPLLALQHATAGAAPGWSQGQLEAELYDPARAGGRNAIVVSSAQDGVRAGAGYVPAGREFFAAPSFAADADAAECLFAELVRRAAEGDAAFVREEREALAPAAFVREEREALAPADFVRVSCGDGEHAKRAGLERLGFTPRFAFLTLARATASPPPATSSAPTHARVEVANVELLALQHANNLAFEGVAKGPAASLDEIRFIVGRVHAPASGVWTAPDGAIAGFIWVLVDEDSRGPHALIDAVATVPGQRHFGLGRAMVTHALGAAGAAGIPEVRALIASNNAASLALHRALGFAEVWRREVWQRDLP